MLLSHDAFRQWCSPSEVPVDRINHVVIVVKDLAASRAFYEKALGLWAVRDDAVLSMHFQGGAIVLVEAGGALTPSPRHEQSGAARVALSMTGTLEEWQRRLDDAHVPVLTGSRARIASDGPAHSIFVEDPDGNVIELDFAPHETA